MTGFLEINDVSLRFGALQVLDHVSVSVSSGQITALIGPNGAGKTALLNSITGYYRPSSGSIQLEGQELLGRRTHEIARLGVGRTFQHVNLFPRLTVVENVLVARDRRYRAGVGRASISSPGVRRAERQERSAVDEVLDRFHLTPYRDVRATQLPYGLQNMLGLARAVAAEPRMLLLDEPASGLTREEKHAFARLLRRMREEWSLPVLWIEHDIEMVMDLADRIFVLDAGIRIAAGTPSEVRNDPTVIEAYLGAAATTNEEPVE